MRPLSALVSAFGLLSLSSAYSQLSDKSLRDLPTAHDDLNVKNGALLAPILQVRVPGTPGIENVRNHFLDFFKTQLPLWTIELSNSTQMTALGRDIMFSNIIATRDPPWAKSGDVGRLALVAHYDSKISPEGFIGAVDSAVPCAAILQAARAIDGALTRKWTEMQSQGKTGDGVEDEKGIQILLLDGEEAFISWTDTDSIYGARALAQEWESAFNPALSTYHNRLNQINLFVLLDLLGSADPLLPSYFPTTHWAYKNMANIEARLRANNLFRSSKPGGFEMNWFPEGEAVKDEAARQGHGVTWMGGAIEDDHIPFIARGIETLHLIPSPFPAVWHRMEDDADHLDQATVEDWATITSVFAAEWMDLEGYIQPERTPLTEKEKRETGKSGVQGLIDRSELFHLE